MDISKINPQEIIDKLGLVPLPFEGGHFARTYTAAGSFPAGALGDAYPAHPRSYCSAIYYFLTDDPDSFSAMHLLPTDEIYHFYLGDPVEMLLIDKNGKDERILLGQDLFAGQQVQFVAPANVWQGSHLLPGGRFALLGTTMSPAYVESDYIEATREQLTRLNPRQQDLIKSLTRH
ncbi:MAG: cupin domain-containing protein [Anaerolineae bacterium]|nr:cupin domain-containing protein [Anaerolineae bacterium]